MEVRLWSSPWNSPTHTQECHTERREGSTIRFHVWKPPKCLVIWSKAIGKWKHQMSFAFGWNCINLPVETLTIREMRKRWSYFQSFHCCKMLDKYSAHACWTKLRIKTYWRWLHSPTLLSWNFQNPQLFLVLATVLKERRWLLQSFVLGVFQGLLQTSGISTMVSHNLTEILTLIPLWGGAGG